MADKLTLADLASLANETSAMATINANNTLIEDAFDNTLSRDGSTPNAMEASIDMNSNRLLNLPQPISNGEPVRLQDIVDIEDSINVINGLSAYGVTLMTTDDAADARDTLGLEFGTDIREPLTANRTYYIRTDGSDSNTGLDNTAGGAWLTLNKAFTYIRDNIDLRGFTVTISVADGTYTDSATANRPWIGRGSVQVVGNTATPANVVRNVTGANNISATNGANLTISGMTLTTTTSGYCLDAGGYGQIGVSTGIVFGAAATGHVVADSHGFVNFSSNYTISGSAPLHWLAFEHGMIECISRTITLTGTPAFSSYFAQSYRSGHITAAGNTYSGSATGVRFYVGSGSDIYTGGTTLTALPGNTAGVFAGGTYDTTIGAGATIAGAPGLSLTPSATLMTTPTAGAFEVDTTTAFITLVAGNRHLIPASATGVLLSTYTLTDTATAQKAFNFNAGNGAIAVAAGTSYLYEGQYIITNTGAGSHTWGVLFALGGGATLASGTIVVKGRSGITSAATLTAETSAWSSTPETVLVATAASTSTSENVILNIKGILRFTTGGTLTPQVKLSATTGGTIIMQAGSHFILTPIGNDTETTTGNWS